MKIFILTFCIFFTVYRTQAQIDKEPIPAPDVAVMRVNSGNAIMGKVVDLQSNKAIEAASVQLFSLLPGTGNEPGKDSLIGVMLTKANGEFRFEKVAPGVHIRIEISVVGYATYTQDFSFAGGEAGSDLQKDLGNIVMARKHETLQGVTIVAERPALSMGIDRKVFDVDKSLTSKGGTAVDIMKNIPSLSVDADGNVELRNTSPTIFVDGRPTILTLDQIASDDIERIELITNPSAKFDASSTGGIINIILKKNKRNGINGMVSLSGGLPSMYGGNANINLRQGKVNFFVSGGYNFSDNGSESSSMRENRKGGITDNYFNQHSSADRLRRFRSIRFGADFFIDNRNTLTLTQGFVKGRFLSDETQRQQYFTSNHDLYQTGVRNSDETFGFDRNNSQLLFTHKFPRDGEQLDAAVTYNYGKVHDRSLIGNSFYDVEGSLVPPVTTVRNEGANDNNQFTAKIDFVNPLGENKKLEMGARSYVNNYENYFNSFAVSQGGETKLPLSNHYKYTENVHAVYITYTGTLSSSIGYQVGVRGEYSKFSGTLIDSAKQFGYEFPSAIKNILDALFPSVYLSKKINDNDEIQLNYSRRVRRPDFWQLNPFIDINDPLNIQQGNPGLQPEFTNSLEFNYNKKFVAGSNFLGVVYYRNTQGDITRYSDTLTAEQYQQLHNAAIDPAAILNTFINSESVNRAGIELTLQQKLGTNFDITPSVNIGYRKVKANAKTLNLSNEGINWNGKLTANYKIIARNENAVFNKMGFQLTTNYHSPNVIPQGKRLERFSMDFAVRKDLFKKDKGSLVLSINDLFNTQRYGVIYDTESFYQEAYSRRRVRSFRLTFSYKFGDADFSLFKRGNNDREHEES